MKKMIITGFIVLFGLSTATFAVEPANTQIDVKPIKNTPETPEVKKTKIETDLRSTIEKLNVVIEKTKYVIDLFNKNKRDTFEASKYLTESQNSLNTANLAVDQLFPVTTIAVKDSKEIKPAFKDPLKKTEESLRASKASLILSIEALKDSLTVKGVN